MDLRRITELAKRREKLMIVLYILVYLRFLASRCSYQLDCSNRLIVNDVEVGPLVINDGKAVQLNNI